MAPMERDASAEAVVDASDTETDWHRRVVGRSLDSARRRSIDRGARLIRAAAQVLERNDGESLTVQEVADEAGQSLRTLYQYFASKDDLLLAVFEEAQRTYARMIRAAIEDLDDPVERLAGGLLASVRLQALHHKAGVDRGLSRLRMQLGQADPALIARSQEPITSIYTELVAAALPAATHDQLGIDEGAWFVASLRSSFILSITLGNDLTVDLPDGIGLSVYCLNGLGIPRPRSWHAEVEERLAIGGDDARTVLRRLAREPRSELA